MNWVDAAGVRITWGLRYSLDNISASNDQQPEVGEQFATVLTADEGYSLPAGINIDMNNVRLTVGADYTYNQTTGDVFILGTGGSGGVTGDIVIEASGI